MLSVVDLIEDGTLDVPTSGYLLAAVANGASFLTAAGPGGVGKSTLLGCLLSFLPPRESIVTVTDPASLPEGSDRRCFLCHEIGSGHWYGYLWGRQAAQFFALRRHGRIAAAIHADTVEQIEDQVLGPQIGADPADLAAVDLVAFMVHQRGLRRVSAIFEAEANEQPAYRQVAEWRATSDDFGLEESALLPPLIAAGPAPQVPAQTQAGNASDFIERLVADGVYLMEDVMAAVAGFCDQHYPDR